MTTPKPLSATLPARPLLTPRHWSLHPWIYSAFPLACLLFALPANLLAQGPVITQQPQNQTVNVGGSATFMVSVSSGTSVSYQWRFNGGNISGATIPSDSWSTLHLRRA